MSDANKYIKNLSAQLDIYKKMLSGVKRQQKAIVDADTAELEKTNALLKDISAQAKELEREREQISPGDADITISRLCKTTDPVRAHVLDTLGGQLRLVTTEVTDATALNSELLSIHFSIVDKITENAAMGVKTNNLYGSSGLEQDENAGYKSYINTQI